jgi:drug/metabolite transporter (DMT)-like permease
MNWLIATILSYFFLALVSLFDRYLLVGPIKSPFAYTFYVGILWFFISFPLIPFGFKMPNFQFLFFGFATGFIRIFAILFLTKAILESEISRVIPAIGALLPIFTFFLFLIFLPETRVLNPFYILAFLLLILGSVFISLEKFSFDFFSFKKLKYPIFASFLFALNFFLTKILYLKLNFVTGLFLILFGGGIGVISFLLFPKIKKEILSQKPVPKVSGIFIFGQAVGGLGVLFQFLALYLAKPNQVPLINALEGVRYVFLLFFVFILSILKPEILKEEIKGKILYQKIFAVLLISLGLAILSFQK